MARHWERRWSKWAWGTGWGALVVGAGVARGEGPTTGPVDKSGFTLFNPVPADLMRPLSTDRPDVTESPYTVDAGHYQVELSWVEYTEQRGEEGGESWSVLPSNLKAGVLNDLDLQLIINPYQSVRTRDVGTAEGFGDMQFRAKLNLWGNDGGPTAGAVMPFVQFPTGTGGLSNHHVEGGVILPLEVELPWGFGMGTEAQFEAVRNAENDGYGVNVLYTAEVYHSVLWKNLSMYVEYVGISPISTGQTYQSFVDTGVTYLVTPNIQLDAGINIGLSSGARGYLLFTGLSFRI